MSNVIQMTLGRPGRVLAGGGGETRGVDPTVGRALMSYEDFYRRHADEVRRALCVALGDTDLGTEATDEALTRAWERWPALSGYANRPGWVYRVGLNWGLSHQRRSRRWRDRRSVPERSISIPDDPGLASALARLAVDHRAVVVCRYLLDWSTEETAAALEIPVGTVKSRLARALDTLQRTLEYDR
jgi:RNA polymerase sigma factor (sigma-70 family)